MAPNTGADGKVLTVKLVPLSLPVVAGLLPITLILYPIPAMVLEGIVPEIVPDAVDVIVPIFIGEVKLPLAFDK